MRNRKGVSLAELLVLMSACTAILSLAAVLLQRTMLVHGKTRAFFAAQRSGLRLSDQLREDVHSAPSAEMSDLPDDLVLRLPLGGGQSAEYRVAVGVIERALLVDGQSKSREQFAFPATSKVAVSKEELPPRIILSVECEPPGPEDKGLAGFAMPVHLRIEAHLGRDATYRAVQSDREAAP